MDPMAEQRRQLVEDLRDARGPHGSFEGLLHMRCESRGCSITEVTLRVNENRALVKRVQPRLVCPLCRNELRFFELEAR